MNNTKNFTALLGSVAWLLMAPSAYAADASPTDSSQLEEVQVTAQRTDAEYCRRSDLGVGHQRGKIEFV